MGGPKWRGVTGRGDGVSCPSNGHTFQGTSGGWKPLKGMGSRAWGDGAPDPASHRTMGAGDGSPEKARRVVSSGVSCVVW